LTQDSDFFRIACTHVSMRLIFRIKKTNHAVRSPMAFCSKKYSVFTARWVLMVGASLVALSADARMLGGLKPSVEIHLDVLQYLSEPAPEFVAAPVEKVEATPDATRHRPDIHAVRKVPVENPYTPANGHASALHSGVKEAPFYSGKSPAARIESRPLPPVATASRPQPAKRPPAKNVTPATPTSKQVAEAKQKNVVALPESTVYAAPKPASEPTPIVAEATEAATTAPDPVLLPADSAPPEPKAELSAARTKTADTLVPPAPDMLPVLDTPPKLAVPKPVAPPPPEVLVKRHISNNPTALPLPDFASTEQTAHHVAELTALPPTVSKRIEDTFAPPRPALTETTRIINPAAPRNNDAPSQAEVPVVTSPPPLAETEPAVASAPPPPPPPLPVTLPPALPSVDSLTDGQGGDAMPLVQIDDGIFSTDPIPVMPAAPQGDGIDAGAQPAIAPPSAQELAETRKQLSPDAVPVVSTDKEEAASLPSGEVVSIAFQPNKQELLPDEKDKLAMLAQYIQDEGKRVHITAYAGGTPDQASAARRISLSRALSIRAFLIDKGVPQLRIDVKAMGNKELNGKSPDRADIRVD
jgi:outer membrane protein OmpA-like peptidoglycan-associated protein